MSKVDALRALREARYAAQAASSRTSPAPSKAASTTPSKRPTTPPAGQTAPAPAAVLACGHRNISGRSCTRPAGHAEKNHRYG